MSGQWPPGHCGSPQLQDHTRVQQGQSQLESSWTEVKVQASQTGQSEREKFRVKKEERIVRVRRVQRNRECNSDRARGITEVQRGRDTGTQGGMEM